MEETCTTQPTSTMSLQSCQSIPSATMCRMTACQNYAVSVERATQEDCLFEAQTWDASITSLLTGSVRLDEDTDNERSRSQSTRCKGKWHMKMKNVWQKMKTAFARLVMKCRK